MTTTRIRSFAAPDPHAMLPFRHQLADRFIARLHEKIADGLTLPDTDTVQ